MPESDAAVSDEDILRTIHDQRPLLLQTTHRFSRFIRGSHLVGVTVILTLTYFFGAAIAAWQGVLPLYLGWYVMIAILLAIGWVTVWLEWARTIYFDLLRRWEANFGTEYKRLLKAHIASIFDNRRPVWVIIPILLVGLGDILAVRLSNGTIAQVASISNWIVLGSLPMFVFLMAVLTAAGYVAGVGVWLIADHLIFMRQLSRLHLKPFRLLSSETHLTELSHLGLVLSLIWFGGVGIGGVILYGDFNEVTIPLFAFAAIIGVTQFLLPQLVLRDLIVGAKKRLKDTLRGWLPDGWEQSDVLLARGDSASVLLLIQQVDNIRDWPIDLPIIIFEFLAALIPFGVTALTQGLGLTVK